MTGAIIPFPGKALVAVVAERDRYAIWLSKPGATEPVRQCSFPSPTDAEREAREVAALCGWTFVGVFDAERISLIEDYCERRPASPLVLSQSPLPDGGDAA